MSLPLPALLFWSMLFIIIALSVTVVILRKQFTKYRELQTTKYVELLNDRNEFKKMVYEVDKVADNLRAEIDELRNSGVEYYRAQNERLLKEINNKRHEERYYIHGIYKTEWMSNLHNRLLKMERELSVAQQTNAYLTGAIAQYSEKVSPQDGELFALLMKAVKAEKGDI